MLDGGTPELVEDTGRGAFDLSAAGDGSAMRTDWVPRDVPWLALDRDGDGRITSGRELFGSASPLASGGTATNGFAALAELDADRDGRVDRADPAFASLVAWYDADGDRTSSSGELVRLSTLGVTALSLAYRREPDCDARGNCAIERSDLVWHDASRRARVGAVVDVHLALR
jgi:hypothetical protein